MPQAVFRNWWFWALIALLAVTIAFTAISGGGQGRAEVNLSQFIEDVRAGQVAKVEVDDTFQNVTYRLLFPRSTSWSSTATP